MKKVKIIVSVDYVSPKGTEDNRYPERFYRVNFWGEKEDEMLARVRVSEEDFAELSSACDLSIDEIADE